MKLKLFCFIILISKIGLAQFQEIQLNTNSSVTEIIYKDSYLYINCVNNYFSRLNINSNIITPLSPISDSNFQCYSLNIVDSNNFWGIAASPSPNSKYLIKHSNDAGQTWSNSSDTLGVFILDLKMNTNTEGYAVGSLGQFLKFNYSTLNWDSLNLGIQYQNIVINTFEDSTIVIGSINFVHTSQDKGTTWITTPIDVQPSCIFIQNKYNIYLSTNFNNLDEADIYKTTNIGYNWQNCFETLNYSVNGIAFFNSSNGIAVGQNKATNKGEIFITNDSAQTWHHYSTQLETEFNNISIINDTTIFLSTTDGRLFKTNRDMLINTSIKNEVGLSPPVFYPNPAQDFIQVKFSNLKESKVSVFDVYGNKLNLYSFQHDNTIIFDTKFLNQGLYFFRIDSGFQISNFKFQIIK